MKAFTLTDETKRGILAGIRAGGFPHVAAAAYGVDEELWERWMSRGRGQGAREPYRSFVREVDAARAQARLRAEMTMLDKDGRTWLKHGPGRDLPGKPGWAALAKPAPPRPSAAANPLESPDITTVMAEVRASLAAFPDALAAATDAIERGSRRKRRPPAPGTPPCNGSIPHLN
jgi:hypothetical protein